MVSDRPKRHPGGTTRRRSGSQGRFARPFAGGPWTTDRGRPDVQRPHRGVLFLDELPEFSTQTLAVLRQPLEDKQVPLARALGTISFPTNVSIANGRNLLVTELALTL